MFTKAFEKLSAKLTTKEIGLAAKALPRSVYGNLFKKTHVKIHGVNVPKSAVTRSVLDRFASHFKSTDVKKNLTHGTLGGLANVGLDAASSELANRKKQDRPDVGERIKQYTKDFAIGFVPTATGSYLGSKAFSTKALHKIKRSKAALDVLSDPEKTKTHYLMTDKLYTPAMVRRIDKKIDKIFSKEHSKQRALAGAGSAIGAVATQVGQKKREK